MLHLVSYVGSEPPESQAKPGVGVLCPGGQPARWNPPALQHWDFKGHRSGMLGTNVGHQSSLWGTNVIKAALDKSTVISLAAENQWLRYQHRIQETQHPEHWQLRGSFAHQEVLGDMAVGPAFMSCP